MDRKLDRSHSWAKVLQINPGSNPVTKKQTQISHLAPIAPIFSIQLRLDRVRTTGTAIILGQKYQALSKHQTNIQILT